MRKKKFIIAFVVFFGIACGVFFFVTRNSYSFDEVATEICKDATYVDQSISCDRKARLASLAASPSALEKVISWYKSNFRKNRYHAGMGMKTIDPNKPILLFYETDSVVVKLTYKMDLVNSVEIRCFSGTSQSALKLKSRLSEKFPGLSCEIITSP